MKEIAEHPHKTRVPPPRGQQSQTNATPVADPDGVQSNGSKLVFTMKATTGNKDSGKAKPTISGFGHSGGKRSTKGKPEATRRRERASRADAQASQGSEEAKEDKKQRKEDKKQRKRATSKGEEPPAGVETHPGSRRYVKG